MPKARRRTVLRLFEYLQAEGYAGACDSVIPLMMPPSPGSSGWNSRCCSRSACRLMPVSNGPQSSTYGAFPAPVSCRQTAIAPAFRPNGQARWSRFASAHIASRSWPAARLSPGMRAQFGRNQLICEPRFTKSWALFVHPGDQARCIAPWAAVHRMGSAVCGGSGSGARAQTGQRRSRFRRAFVGRPRDWAGSIGYGLPVGTGAGAHEHVGGAE